MSTQSSTSKISTTSTSLAAAAPKKVNVSITLHQCLGFVYLSVNYYRDGVRRGQLRQTYRTPPLITEMMMTYSTLQLFSTVNCLAKSIMSKLCTYLYMYYVNCFVYSLVLPHFFPCVQFCCVLGNTTMKLII